MPKVLKPYFPKLHHRVSIAGQEQGPIPDGQCRVYESTVTTSTTVNGQPDSSDKKITYEIGKRTEQSLDILRPLDKPAHRLNAEYELLKRSQRALERLDQAGIFSGSFETANLAGVVERLAKCLTAESVYGDVGLDTISGGIQPIISHDSSENVVFMPQISKDGIGQDTWTVLVYAIYGEGGVVQTSESEFSGRLTSSRIAVPIVDALQVLESNMNEAKQGPLFALALTRGIHAVVSVFGHTDEGILTREILRTGQFAPPHGGISNPRRGEYHLPQMLSGSRTEVTSYVDSIALVTAAAVAHADPGSRVGGEWYPQTFVGTRENSIQANVLASIDKFSRYYCKGLGYIFASQGDGNLAANVFRQAATHYLGPDNKVLDFASASPWFWVEPTSLLSRRIFTHGAEISGSASLVGPDETDTWNALPDCELSARDSTPHSTGLYLTFRSARRVPMLLHFLGKDTAALRNVVIRQMIPDYIVHQGAGPASMAGPEDLTDRLYTHTPITDYLWRRRRGSPFRAPSELVYLDKKIGIEVQHAPTAVASEKSSGSGTAMYTSAELAKAKIKLRCTSTLVFKETRQHVDHEYNVCRGATLGARLLAAAALENGPSGNGDGNKAASGMPVKTSVPGRHDAGGEWYQNPLALFVFFVIIYLLTSN